MITLLSLTTREIMQRKLLFVNWCSLLYPKIVNFAANDFVPMKKTFAPFSFHGRATFFLIISLRLAHCLLRLINAINETIPVKKSIRCDTRHDI